MPLFSPRMSIFAIMALKTSTPAFQAATPLQPNRLVRLCSNAALSPRVAPLPHIIAPITCAMRTKVRTASAKGAPRRRLSSNRTVVPDGIVHDLKGDVDPIPLREAPGPVPKDAAGLVLLKSMTLSELENWVETTLEDKKFRARQLWRWLYRSEKLAATFDEMTDLSKSFREKLKQHARIDTLAMNSVHQSEDGTRKLTYRLDSGGVIESVVIPTEGRTTLCVSSQWGCALNCQFCLTGRTGFKRSLTHGEIVDQVVMAKRFFESEGRIGNVVFMGEGEPAHNLENVMRAVETMIDLDGLHLSHNKITVSTSGLVPEIREFAKTCKANLAVSLHATNDDLRSWLMPINRKYPLGELMQTLRDVFPRESTIRQQKVFFQYLMLKGVNDSLMDAKELLRLTSGVPCKINLIHFNSHEGTEFEASDHETMLAFQDFLVKKGMTVTIRKSRGDDKMMACGQLGKLGPEQAPRMRVPDKYVHLMKSTTNKQTPVEDNVSV